MDELIKLTKIEGWEKHMKKILIHGTIKLTA